jgi:hypothetical protein
MIRVQTPTRKHEELGMLKARASQNKPVEECVIQIYHRYIANCIVLGYEGRRQTTMLNLVRDIHSRIMCWWRNGWR